MKVENMASFFILHPSSFLPNMSHHDADILDRHAYTDSVMHRVDPRAKLIVTLVVTAAVVSHDKYAVARLVPFVFFPMAMAILGYVPVRLLAKRLLIASPFLIFIGIFNPIMDRVPVHIFGGLSISGGWLSFFSILFRGFLCVGMAIILTATTSFPSIAKAARSLGAPRILVVQLMLLYRYLFLLIGEAGRMNRSKTLRAANSKTSIKTAAAMLSSLLLRTLARSESIWLAMKARGFDGDLKTAQQMKFRFSDFVFLAAFCLLCVSMRVFPLTHLIGNWGIGH